MQCLAVGEGEQTQGHPQRTTGISQGRQQGAGSSVDTASYVYKDRDVRTLCVYRMLWLEAVWKR